MGRKYGSSLVVGCWFIILELLCIITGVIILIK